MDVGPRQVMKRSGTRQSNLGSVRMDSEVKALSQHLPGMCMERTGSQGQLGGVCYVNMFKKDGKELRQFTQVVL